MTQKNHKINQVKHAIKWLFIAIFALQFLTIKQSFAQGAELSLEPSSPQNDATQNSQLIPQNSKEEIGNLLLGNSPTSLMFDDEQTSDIDRAADSFLNNKSYTPEIPESQSSEDQKALEDAKIKSEEEEARNEKSYLYLASILYLSPKNWSIWIGDQKITAQTNDKNRELYVKSISKDKAKILWKLSLSKWKIITGKRSDESIPKINQNNQVENVFEIRPNQTFMLNENKVMEGKAYIKASIPDATKNNNLENKAAEKKQ